MGGNIYFHIFPSDNSNFLLFFLITSFFTIKIPTLQTARAHLISARELTSIDNLTEAEKEYRKSILLDPCEAEVIIEFAEFLTSRVDSTWLGINKSDISPILRCSSYGEAKCLFEEALSDDMPTRTRASDAEAYYQLGVIARRGNVRKYISFYKDALKSDPDHYAKVEHLTMMKCRPWLFLPDDDHEDGDKRTPLFDERVEYDLFSEEWESGSLG